MESCFEVGGVKESWLVARKREKVARLESNAALLCDALSLSMPIRSVSFVIFCSGLKLTKETQSPLTHTQSPKLY